MTLTEKNGEKYYNRHKLDSKNIEIMGFKGKKKAMLLPVEGR